MSPFVTAAWRAAECGQRFKTQARIESLDTCREYTYLRPSLTTGLEASAHGVSLSRPCGGALSREGQSDPLGLGTPEGTTGARPGVPSMHILGDRAYVPRDPPRSRSIALRPLQAVEDRSSYCPASDLA